MKLKITYTNFNVLVPRLVAKVYKVTPFGLPDGILASLFTAKGQLIGSSAADTPAMVPASAADGYSLIADSAQASGMRWGAPTISIDDNSNQLINGGFDFAQRQTPGTDTTIADEAYSADRWCITRENAALQYSRQDASSETGLTSRHYGKFTKITNAGKFMIFQPLRFIDSLPLRARTVILQLQMKASAAKTIKIAILELQAAGTADTLPAALVAAWNTDSTDPTLGTNLAVAGSVQSCSVTTSWQTFSVSTTVPADSKNLIAAVWTDADFSAADYLCLAEAGLYRANTTQAWAPRQYATELQLCQTYYQKSYETDSPPASVTSLGRRSGIAATTSFILPFGTFDAPMRAAPTIGIWSVLGTASKVTTFAGVDTGTAAAATAYANEKNFYAINDAGSYTANAYYTFHFAAEAEL